MAVTTINDSNPAARSNKAVWWLIAAALIIGLAVFAMRSNRTADTSSSAVGTTTESRMDSTATTNTNGNTTGNTNDDSGSSTGNTATPDVSGTGTTKTPANP